MRRTNQNTATFLAVAENSSKTNDRSSQLETNNMKKYFRCTCTTEYVYVYEETCVRRWSCVLLTTHVKTRHSGQDGTVDISGCHYAYPIVGKFKLSAGWSGVEWCQWCHFTIVDKILGIQFRGRLSINRNDRYLSPKEQWLPTSTASVLARNIAVASETHASRRVSLDICASH